MPAMRCLLGAGRPHDAGRAMKEVDRKGNPWPEATPCEGALQVPRRQTPMTSEEVHGDHQAEGTEAEMRSIDGSSSDRGWLRLGVRAIVAAVLWWSRHERS